MTARPHFQRLVERVRSLPPLPAAFVYPCDRDSLQAAISAQFAGYMTPLLVGPEGRIADAAGHAGIDLSRVDIVDTPDDPHAAAQRAVALARDGEVRSLIKGSLYPDDLMRAAAAPDTGLRSDRRLTHAFYLDVPGYPRSFVLSDALLNIAPNLAAKRDIVLNAIGFAHALGVATPNVALLAAVEGVTPAFPATVEASALTKMAAQGMFNGGNVSGPITFDAAISAKHAQSYGIESPVAGQADVLIVPTLESGALVVRALSGMFDALAAGIVLGGSVPIVLGTRHDSMEVRMASCVLASLLAEHLAPSGKRAGLSDGPQAAARVEA